MADKANYQKKHTIFRIFLVPLIGIMLTQSLLMLGTLTERRTVSTIQEYSVSMMSRTVENRRVILENELVRSCSNIYRQEDTLNLLLGDYLRERGCSLDQLLADHGYRQELLAAMFPKCLGSLQSAQTTGIFLVLTGEDTGKAADFDGFFVRDSDPRIGNENNSDLLFERGTKELSRAFGVPLDTSWTTSFHMAGQGQRDADAYFYEPWRAGRENPDADIKDLGYWSEPFILEDGPNDAHRMITYSVPLRYEGRVYGVLGIELSDNYLYEYFPIRELSETERSGYLLAVGREDGSYSALLGKGILYNEIAAKGGRFTMDGTKYDGLFRVEDIRLGARRIYTVSCPLKLYDRFAPYENVDWVLLGLNTEDELFGMGRRLYLWIGISILLGLVFAVAGIYFLVLHLTRPIKGLMECIINDEAGLGKFEDTNILEIDALHNVIKELTARQKEAASILQEEKERYRVALESTSDTFFTYDIRSRSLDIVNHPAVSGNRDQDKGITFDINHVYYEDRELLRGIPEEVTDKVYVEFRYLFFGQTDYQWYALSGKIVEDAEGIPYKLVGRLRNIQEQKEQERQQQEKMERDSVTGLYAFKAGRTHLHQCYSEDPRGAVVYVLLDKLQEINERNGIVFGDMILEEMGRIIRECCQKLREEKACRTVAVRIDGDEFALWLEGAGREQAQSFVRGMLCLFGEMFAPDVFRVQVCAGIALSRGEEDSAQELLRRAKLAQIRAKESGTEGYVFYEDVPAGLRCDLPILEGKPVISNDYGEDVNLAALALNLFGKGANLPAQMSLILRKIGCHYGACDVLATIIHSDFRSNYLEYQWHREAEAAGENIVQYTDEERKAFQEWLGMEQVRSFTAAESGSPVLRKFLYVREGQAGIVLPMYDSGSYMGNVCILGVDPLLAQDAEERHKLGEIRDVLQSQINQQQHDLASRAKSDFLSRMSHEIRTPMNGIIGMTAIALQQGQSTERMIDCLNKIQNSSQYLLGLINDILDMSKIESGKMHLEPENFNLQETADSIAELMRPQIAAKEIEFVQNTELTDRWYNADKMRISQVLINLLGNAVKFTAQGGRIVLTVQERGERNGLRAVYFAVEDNGVGISEEDRKRVFRSFEQANGSNSVSKQQGTGLGLSISSRLVQMMGGAIELDSEVGRGSRFSFEICLEPGRSEQKATAEAEEISFEGCHVLLVEDNELNREIASCLLEEHGFAVDHACDGAEAVDKVKNNAPGTYDVVLMDIMMPVMDGLEATRVIRGLDREDCRTLPIIAMSANAFDDDMKKSVECGMNGHLTKPVEVDKLYRMLRDILRPAECT